MNEKLPLRRAARAAEFCRARFQVRLKRSISEMRLKVNGI
jgi:hypothetical protein